MAQIDSAHFYKAGTELRKFERQYTAGTAMQIGGLALAITGASVEKGNTSKTPVLIAGGFLSFIGFILQVTSAAHIKNAGVYLQGKNLVIPFGNKKKV